MTTSYRTQIKKVFATFGYGYVPVDADQARADELVKALQDAGLTVVDLVPLGGQHPSYAHVYTVLANVKYVGPKIYVDA